MPITRKERDFLIFFGGVLLGILGNLWVELLLGIFYPEGIQPNTAIPWIILLSLTIILEITLFYRAIITKPART